MPPVRLQMSETQDRLSLAFNTFFSDLYVPAPADTKLSLRFVIAGRDKPADDPMLTLQLKLKAGETLETGAGRTVVLGPERINLGPDDLGGWIRHHGWTLRVDPGTRLVWPVYPFNPYANGPEKDIEQAVGALRTPLRLKPETAKYVRPNEQEITFVLEVN